LLHHFTAILLNALRSYLDASHQDKHREIGSEQSPDAYIATMVAVFREIRRVMRDDATAWINLGDSFRDKQLLMMPARLALALQAPQHYGPIAKETDRAWLAAMMDGEGTISIARNVSAKSRGGVEHCQPGYTPFVSMGNQDRELVDRCAEITGHGKSGLKDRPSIDSRQIVSRRDYFGWRIDARKAIEVIRDIYPFLVAKRKQAVLAYNLSLSNDGGRALRGNGRLPQSEQEKREYLKLLINACNQRKPVDMPSWLIEPPSNVEQGWWLRSDIIWAKPNPMPESCTDRCVSAHEHVFMLTKRPRYYFDSVAIAEPAINAGRVVDYDGTQKNCTAGDETNDMRTRIQRPVEVGATRACRNVWTIATHAYPAAHFATYPPALVERCVRAGTSERGCCAACGAPWVRQGDKELVDVWHRNKAPTKAARDTAAQQQGDQASRRARDGHVSGHAVQFTTTGWLPSCQCNADVAPCTVLDPFLGSGTTALVADRLQRHCIGIDLSTTYADLARNRVTDDCPLFTSWAPVPGCGGSGGRAPGEEGVLDRRCPEHPVETPEDARMADLFADLAAD
jgi:DNA modification methylase